jgi:succinate dehydrogenase / fumarate reductase cytochrome b subunit
MTDAPKPIRERPLSPHMEIWRWHITMLSSILHRATGVALYVGALIAAYWALALASGPVGYENFLALIGSPLGKLVLFGLTVSIFYHLANGVRHLFWDSGEGFTPATANLTAAAAITFAVVVSVFIWGAALFTGAAL